MMSYSSWTYFEMEQMAKWLYGKPKTLIADMLTYVAVDNAAIKSGVTLEFGWRTKADLIKADLNLKSIKNKKVAIVSTESMLAKTYHIGQGMYTMAQVVYAG